MTFQQFYEQSELKIFCDMDSVLVDWNGAFEKLGVGLAADYEIKYGQTAMWKLINKEGEDFWANASWMPDGKQLWEFIKPYNPTILTKPTRSDQGRQICINGKKTWLARELPNVPYIMEDNKEIHAGKNKILIDDLKENITKWIGVGGIGVLHFTADNTIRQLQNIFDDHIGNYKA